ncbi:MAG: TonB-dependent receptor [Prevotellaceae bacterium]|jgi:TonB-linked SusC/RagA family outer membrane protein|nr:TonB-dependent receptor [Prevotellaceae bacterium]
MTNLFHFAGISKRTPAIFSLFFALLCGAAASGQVSLTGRVLDSRTSEALVGASVKVSGSAQGAVVGADGSFTFIVAALPVSIEVSLLGYRTQALDVYEAPAQPLAIYLAEDFNALDEVVVVGYGTQRKVSVTNAISQLAGREIADRPVASIRQSLQGKLPGVTVQDLGGSPGRASTSIRIRGITSFNTSKTNGTSGYDLSKNNALVIVDGIEQDLANVNPDDIETVSVLKDASSTAIYGSRGTNGVILVTTKGAKSGKVQVDVNSYVGWQRSNNTPEPMGLEAYMKEQQWAYKNAGRDMTLPANRKYTDEGIAEWVNATDREKYPLPNTWFQTLLHTAPQHNTSASVTGGTEVARARLSLRYFDQKGVVDRYGDNLAEGKLSTDFTISPALKVNAILNYRSNSYYYPTETSDLGAPLNRFFHGTLWATPKYDDGTYGLSTQSANPLMFIEKGGLSRTKNDYLTGNVKAAWEITKGLTFSSQLGVAYNAAYSKKYANAYTNTDKNTNITKTVDKNSLTEERNSAREYTLNNLLTYAKAIGRHDLSALLGYSQIAGTSAYLSAYRERFYNNDISSIGQGANDATKSNDGRDEEYGLRSYFGRINYGYAGKYLVEANGRYDGSSKFTGSKQYGFFPSFSAGWLISEERFWAPLRATVSSLKVRGSWGITGNQSVDLYSYYASLVSQGYSFGGAAVSGYRQTTLANTDLGWESTTQTDVGLVASWFGKLEVTVDYYKKVTNDILLNLDIPATVGLLPSPQNAGSVENRGWEFSFALRDETSYRLGYAVSGNLSINDNKVTDLKGTGPYFHGDAGTNPYYTIAEGLPINTLWGYKTDGLFQTAEEIEAYRGGAGRHPFNQLNPQPGDVKYLDLNGDGAIGAEDMRELGHAFPRYTFGLSAELAYRNFELSALLQGAADVDVRLAGALAEMGNQEGFTHKIYENSYWTPDNPNARFPRPVKGDLKNVASSDRLIIDASYLRLKNLQLAYSVPLRALLRATVVKKLRVYASASNLLTFSKLNEWNLDPEVESGRAVYFPQTSIYAVGINLQF